MWDTLEWLQLKDSEWVGVQSPVGDLSIFKMGANYLR